jgi:A/G-specific adenine glycosylase
VLISEVMLQQTQASRVAGHYERFLERYPTVEALAASSRAEVLAAWQGLGYNRRAARLHQAARQIAADGWPEPADLGSLPGVGPYTAAAVACFGFGAQVAAPDTNARRVLSRWHGTPLSNHALRDAAHDEVPAGRAADWNQALMDLGATVCRPRDPECDRCPVTSWCTDPTVYEPPRPQGRFEGSNREARGAVVRHLVQHSRADLAGIAAASGLPIGRVATAVDGLMADGLVAADGSGGLSLAEGR